MTVAPTPGDVRRQFAIAAAQVRAARNDYARRMALKRVDIILDRYLCAAR